ncbi:MAG: VOC family protein [Cyanobacteria bacterium P01_F01_bin.33]
MKIQSALVSLATSDLARSKQFYESLLGIFPAIVWSNKYVEFRLSGLRLGLYASTHPDFQARLGATSICLQVDDLDEALRSPFLSAVNVSSIREAGHGREIDFCDPDGNRVILHQPSISFRQLLKWNELK